MNFCKDEDNFLHDLTLAWLVLCIHNVIHIFVLNLSNFWNDKAHESPI